MANITVTEVSAMNKRVKIIGKGTIASDDKFALGALNPDNSVKEIWANEQCPAGKSWEAFVNIVLVETP